MPSPHTATTPFRCRATSAGILGVILLLLLAALQFLPPIPPLHKSYSIPGYLLSLLVAALLAIEVHRQAPAIVAGWRRVASGRVRGLAAALVTAGLVLALLFRWAAPEPFDRFSREEGVWEPLTLTCFLAGAILLWRAKAKPWRLLAIVYLWLALEEIDYFGVFGGLIGRIQGEYAGGLHDLVRLVSLGIVGPVGIAIVALVAVVVTAFLWRAGYVQPGWVVARLTDPRVAWAVAGLAVIGVAAAEEADALGWRFAKPRPEEALELAGAALLALYALEEAAGPASEDRRVPR